MPAVPRQPYLYWWSVDDGVLPDALDDAWEALTGSATLEDDGFEVASAGGRDGYYRTIEVKGLIGAPTAKARRIVAQAKIRGEAQANGWGAGTFSPIGMLIDDGARSLAVSVGPTLALVDPSTGAEVRTVSTSHDWIGWHVYRLEKRASSEWLLYVDDRLVARVGYLVAPAAATSTPIVFVGQVDPSGFGTSTATYNELEVGIDLAPPMAWEVDRWRLSLPAPIQTRWNAFARAALRATVGIVRDVLESMKRVEADLGAVRTDFDDFDLYAAGDTLPSALSPAWTVNGTLTVERGRLRTDLTSANVIYTEYNFASANRPPDDTVWGCRCTFTLHEFSSVGDWPGPFIFIRNGDKNLGAHLKIDGDGYLRWHLTNGYYGATFGDGYRVNAYAAHEVEMIVLGHDVVLLLVDGVVVERVDYSSFGGATAVELIRVGRGYNGGSLGPTQCEVDLERITLYRRVSDLGRRNLFLQQCIERLIFVGGCERNDELEVWLRHHYGVQQGRGAIEPTVAEVRRLTCTEQAQWDVEEEEASWFLEVTYPELTPVFLEVSGVFRDAYLEFIGGAALNFTEQELADLLVRYLLPISTLELAYHAAVHSVMTAASSATATYTQLTVNRTADFEAGDEVTVRDAAGATREEAEVVSIVSATVIRVGLADGLGGTTALANSYTTGDILRKTLATS